MSRVVSVGREILDIIQDEEVTFLAAAIAYYAFVSLFPAILLALVVASVIGGERLVAQVLTASEVYLTPAGQDIIGETLGGARGRAGATVVGLLILAWTTLRVFRGLDIAFSRVYGTSAGSYTRRIQNAIVVVLSIGIGIGAMIVVGVVLAWADLPVHRSVLGLVVLLVGLVIVFLPLYYVFPGRPVQAAEALPGAVFAAVGWVFLQALFHVYASVAEGYDLYGVVGGILLTVTWFYVAAIVILIGAAVNVVLAGLGNRQEQGDRGRDSVTAAMDREVDEADVESANGVRELRREFEAFKADVENRTVHREEIKAELKRYVRSRLRRGHARGWGPYLVLLYGTVMTVGAFYLLTGGWAILAMLVVWLSTLGLYVVMLVVGAGLHALSLPGRAIEGVRGRRR